MSDHEDEDDKQDQGADEAEVTERDTFSRWFADVVKRGEPNTLRLFEQKGGEYFSCHGTFCRATCGLENINYHLCHST